MRCRSLYIIHLVSHENRGPRVIKESDGALYAGERCHIYQAHRGRCALAIASFPPRRVCVYISAAFASEERVLKSRRRSLSRCTLNCTLRRTFFPAFLYMTGRRRVQRQEVRIRRVPARLKLMMSRYTHQEARAVRVHTRLLFAYTRA